MEFCGKYYFRSSPILKKGDRIPQHKHDVPHPTFCCSGSADFYVDGLKAGTVTAGHAVEIEAGHLHAFVALEDNTRLTCIFNADEALRLREKGY